MLFHNSFKYRIKSRSTDGGSSYYICCRNRATGCTGRLIVRENGQMIEKNKHSCVDEHGNERLPDRAERDDERKVKCVETKKKRKFMQDEEQEFMKERIAAIVSLNLEVRHVEEKIELVEEQIQDMQDKVAKCEELFVRKEWSEQEMIKFENLDGVHLEKSKLDKKEEQLRKKEEQLRTEKEQLRAEKLIYLQEKLSYAKEVVEMGGKFMNV